MMRTAMAVASTILLLLLLAATAQGIRLEEESSGAFQKKVLQGKNRNMVGGPKRGSSSTPLCSEDGQCSDLRSRKLLTDHEAKAEPKSSQKLGPAGGGAPPKPAAAVPSELHKKSATGGGSSSRETYPDLMDIAGMDYSPAVRKPPIHN